LLAACYAPAPYSASAADREYAPAEGVVTRAEAPQPARTGFFDDAATAPGPDAAIRKMVFQAEFALEVAHADQAIAKLVQRAQQLGGYLSQRADETVTVRVPADQFDAFTAELRGYGRVLSENLRAHDVTQQHVDLAIRLENARKARERVLALLQQATKVEEILAVEKELARLTTEIEQLQAQLEQLENQIALATITVQFQGAGAQDAPRPRRPSAFEWIDQIGVDRVRSHF
jgi:hypothetical protein